ncbi:MAG: LysM peptidoglycan-binding domain-containing protein [bacterium]|uniref:LysM domain-containing protein n=2 Tax=Bacteria candidate phyla TaxID=1783234 RepID=A0A117M5Z2_UNCT6|nr:MAG: hypothetical protein XD76_0877 [candidate division TA06 bacterium 32_111]KUK86261.1 MAG: hypothetical protein XE03_1632 [candidate division TA06 bacterium 34_109]MDI6699945.1 LysM peptidoglycan-binding domain-containing protein [bacterium]HAF08399.1 hypothetical protein [candidate division WOR-3 bacterium]HCP15947.1 hypothetical protein [candidate division WOR-3 bacterium]
MKSKVFIVVLLLILSTVLFAQNQKMTETEVLDAISMEQARLDAANAKLEECKNTHSPLMTEVENLRKEKEDLIAQLNNLKETRGFYTVKPGDWLSKLAEYKEVYGKGGWKRWPEIYRANKRLIKDPNLIYPNWKLTIPRP